MLNRDLTQKPLTESAKGTERGATALLVAASLLLLMGMAAVAVDLGSAFNERTQGQSAVDFAALAALHEAVGATTTAAITAGEAAARDYVARNLPGRTLNWATCTDPGRPSEFVNFLPSSPCISFTVNFAKSRVLLPIDSVGTTFGRVLGMSVINVRNLAEAGQATGSSAQIVPLTLSPVGTTVCLYSNQAPQTVPPCDGPSDGNFGYLDIALYGNEDQGTPPACTTGTGVDRIAINLAKGSDHNMIIHTGTTYNDHVYCPNRSIDVNQLEVKTGSPGGGITPGLITGVSGSIGPYPITATPGRLRCGVSGVPSAPNCASWSVTQPGSTPGGVNSGGGTVSVRGTLLDDVPLWAFLDPDWLAKDGSGDWILDLPGDCRPEEMIGGSSTETIPNTNNEMDACLAAWTDGIHSRLFTADIAMHRRFIAAPVFASYPTTGAAASYNIVDFAPVYIKTTYQNCNANRCRTVFTPGEAGGTAACPNPLSAGTLRCGLNDTSGSDAVEGVTGFLLKKGMLHEDISDTFPGVTSTRTTALSK